jgi:hypothetical protein
LIFPVHRSSGGVWWDFYREKLGLSEWNIVGATEPKIRKKRTGYGGTALPLETKKQKNAIKRAASDDHSF